MTDILIRDVPDDVVAAIDANARQRGLSRTEYLRRALARERNVNAGEVDLKSLEILAGRIRDLGDPEVMGRAWS